MGRPPLLEKATTLMRFSDSPSLFGHILGQIVEKFILPTQMCLLQYVDDLHLSVGTTTPLGNQGLWASKNM